MFDPLVVGVVVRLEFGNRRQLEEIPSRAHEPTALADQPAPTVADHVHVVEDVLHFDADGLRPYRVGNRLLRRKVAERQAKIAVVRLELLGEIEDLALVFGDGEPQHRVDVAGERRGRDVVGYRQRPQRIEVDVALDAEKVAHLARRVQARCRMT